MLQSGSLSNTTIAHGRASTSLLWCGSFSNGIMVGKQFGVTKQGHGHRTGNIDTSIGEMGRFPFMIFEIRNMGFGIDFDMDRTSCKYLDLSVSFPQYDDVISFEFKKKKKKTRNSLT